MRLEAEQLGQHSFFRVAHWLPAHGFFGRSVNAGADHELINQLSGFRQFERHTYVSLRQVHGNKVIEISGRDIAVLPRGALHRIAEGDALLLHEPSLRTFGVGFVLRTADCVPLIFRAGEHWGLVHAGWRGLATGVVENTLKVLYERAPDQALEVAIGPAAGRRKYDVGSEVIEALGARGVIDNRGAKYFLALAETAANICRNNWNGPCSEVIAPVCTIESAVHWSHRREPHLSGRNLTFLGF